MENDLISRSALAKMLSTFTMTITGLRAGKGVLREYMTEYRKSVLRIVDEAPAVDAVEVVRCRDCGRFMEYTEEYKATIEGADGDCYIRKINSEDEQFCAVMYDDFCSDGRRRADRG